MYIHTYRDQLTLSDVVVSLAGSSFRIPLAFNFCLRNSGKSLVLGFCLDCSEIFWPDSCLSLPLLPVVE
ncbi:hypothetical protein HanPSC8_Chr05g0212471 [Helianthus annuus]|nr:hypothetical protein HanPSC8_Chr05g0212471 [Helianthus annuus]